MSLVLMTVVFSFAINANAGEALELTSAECSSKYQFLDLKKNRQFFVRAETTGAFVELNAEGLTYHLEFTGLDKKNFVNPTNIQFAVWKIEKDDQGRLTKLGGSLHQMMVSGTDSQSMKQIYESTSEYLNDEEVLQTFVIDGKALEPVKTIRRKLPTGETEVTTINKNVDEEGQFRILSNETKCVYKPRNVGDLATRYPALLSKIADNFSTAPSSQRGDFLTLIDLRELQREIRRTEDRNRRIIVDQDVRSGGNRMWENENLIRMLYRSSPMARFRFCSLGC